MGGRGWVGGWGDSSLTAQPKGETSHANSVSQAVGRAPCVPAWSLGGASAGNRCFDLDAAPAESHAAASHQGEVVSSARGDACDVSAAATSNIQLKEEPVSPKRAPMFHAVVDLTDGPDTSLEEDLNKMLDSTHP